MREETAISLVLLLGLLGGAVKIGGGILYGSRSLLVDSFTCFANIIALIATIYFYRESIRPPDIDHHYGHARLGFIGAMLTILAYSFVAGFSIAILYYSLKYEVDLPAVYTAIVGFIIYGVAVLLSMRIGKALKTYGVFTVSELIESIVVVITSFGGAVYTYLIDYGGAIILTGYIFIEIYATLKDLLKYLSDTAPPPEVIEKILDIIRRNGLVPVSYRFRITAPGLIHGDVVVAVADNIRFADVPNIISRVKDEARRVVGGVDLVVECSSPRRREKEEKYLMG